MPNVALSVDYVGNRSRNQTALLDINEPRPLPDGTVGRPGVDVFDPTGELIPAEARGARFQRVLQFQTLDALNGDFDSLEIAVEKRYTQRWSGRLAYTLAEAHDVGIGGLNNKRFTNDLDPRGDYGRTNFDNRHAFALSLNTNPWLGLGAGAIFRYYSGYPSHESIGGVGTTRIRVECSGADHRGRPGAPGRRAAVRPSRVGTRDQRQLQRRRPIQPAASPDDGQLRPQRPVERA